MRLHKHHHLTFASGRRQAVVALGLRAGQQRRFLHCQVDGVWDQVWVKALADNEFSFLFASPGLRGLTQLYASRWTIEQCFQNLKGRGFNLADTHLRCRHKLRKFVALAGKIEFAALLPHGLPQRVPDRPAVAAQCLA